jgi:hypothetical protein
MSHLFFFLLKVTPRLMIPATQDTFINVNNSPILILIIISD